MKKVVGSALLGLVVFGVASMACKKEDASPTATTPSATATGYPPGSYPPGTYPPATGYPATGYPPATATAYPPATGYPPATATATPPVAPQGTMAVPGPLALPCQNDSGCGLARCNVQYQKCAFPCVNAAVDCIAGAQCMAGACVPKMGQ